MPWIVDAARVPIGKWNGIYKNIIPEDLAAFLISELTKKHNDLHIEEVLLANASGTGGNMARYAVLQAGLPKETVATTIDAQCSGGLRVIEMACKGISSDAIVIAGGLESHSLAPIRSYKTNDPRFRAELKSYEVARFSPDQSDENALLQAAENVALKNGITKEQMWQITLNSHKNAYKAQDVISKYIFKLQEKHFDQSIKSNLSWDLLKNASKGQLIDKTVAAHYHDAAAVVIISKDFLEGSKAEILYTATVGNEPHLAPEGVLAATQLLLQKCVISLNQIALFEVNESFALTPLIFSKHFAVDLQKINVLGGSLAYGHPFGASGTVQLIHLLAGLSSGQLGLAVCPGAGGQATAVLIRKC